MTDDQVRIDHVAVAMAQIAAYPHNLDPFASAQVHATLAVAEQLRIANLIAVQHIEFLARNKSFEADLWNDHIGPALGFDASGKRTRGSAS